MANDGKDRRGLGGGDGQGGPGLPRPKFSPWLTIPILLLVLIVFNSLISGVGTSSIEYSKFTQLVEEGQITGVLTVSNSDISGTYDDAGNEVSFSTQLAPNLQLDSTFTDFLQSNGVQFKFTQPSILTSLLVNILPFILVMLLVYFFIFRKMGGGAGGALNLGKNKVKVYDRKEMKSTFADVAGVDEAKDELREIVDFLKNPKKYQRLGGRIPKGVLLLGPPGCGKTLLARAVAGEANVPFFFMSGSEFVEMFVGLGAARVRELFQQAKEKAPALVFLDEIDTIGKGRGGAMSSGFGGHDEREQTLNQLLVEMDGFDASKGVIIMAATNRPDVLDPALVRPGRFDRQVVVDRPDLTGREEILRVHSRGVALDPAVNLHMIAARTPGFTGADLANVVNEAALLAARREKNAVTAAELDEAIDRASVGLERKSRVMSEKTKTRVAYHEMGHALVAHYSESSDPVHRITIVPRGTAALGLTWTRPLEDRFLITERELKETLARALGGRVAENIVFNEISTGAHSDLEGATQIARAMVAQYGMSEKIGPLSIGADDPNPFSSPNISGATAQVIDEEVKRLLVEAEADAAEILNEHRDLLEKLSGLLLVVETIDGADLEDYAAGTKPIPDPETARRNLPAAVPPVPQAAAAQRLPEPSPQTPPMPAIE